MRFDGQAVVVTGAGSGIGRASALRFASEGAAVVVADVRGSAAAATVEEIVEAGGRAVKSETDVGEPEAVEAMIGTATREFDRLDVVFSNAATTIPGMARDLSVVDWNAMWQVNVSSLFLVAKHAVPVMVAAGGGAIVATASVSGLAADRGQIGYATTKSAVMGLVRALAVDHARDGIRVNCVCPGMTSTPPMEAFFGDGPLRNGAEDAIPAGRLADPDEIAAVACWLASADSSYVNGQAVVADGGLGVESAFSRLLRTT